MIVKRLSMCGFRGTKSVVDLMLPSGFVVIAGQNGSGKSTICDAVEFALTGHFRSTGHKEKGESIDDYVWWRGSGAADDRFVTLWLAAPDGGELCIKRTPAGVTVNGSESPDTTIRDALCDGTAALADALPRLCRTSIIRDEEITTLSVDLPESERFDFVRLALASTDVTVYEERAKAVQGLLDRRAQQAQSGYTMHRTRVADITARLSTMRSEASVASEIGAAEAVVRQVLNLPSLSARELLERASEAVAARRVQIDHLVRLIERVRSIEQRQSQMLSESHQHRVDQLAKQLHETQAELTEAERRLASIEGEIEKQRAEQPRLEALASLHQSGQRLGLENGQSCPLCGSSVDQQGFAGHLSAIQDRLNSESSATMRSAQERVQVQQQVAVLRRQREAADSELQRMQNARLQLDRELAEARSVAAGLGLSDIAQPLSSAELSQRVEALRTTYSDLERSVAVLETSRTLERITQLEGELEAAKSAAALQEQSMEAANKVLQQAKDAVAAIKRLRGEAIDDSLAELSPLMTELYLRLRPHAEWQDINYRLRGDVRRMLRFEVGDGLNPSFVFSSGQRRAAGLAFLLAVYLARPWCKLRTLILDDPVQHVDDFRALNLTEVLASIRPLGKQIICTTEDTALAELMCRRLRSTGGDTGCLVEMTYDSCKGVHVSLVRPVPPLSHGVLIPASLVT